MTPDPSQRAAILAAVNAKRLHIITGAAGTGKTTVIRHIAEAILGKCILLAPTGKAAARVRDATGIPASTIHRELRYDGTEFQRRGRIHEPVIIDEASMLDSAILAKLLDYHPPKMILIGDVDQLPPVGSGQPFHDLVAANVNVSRLTVNHRSKQAVHHAAEAIRAGTMPLPREKTAEESWAMYDTGPAAPTTAKLVSWIKAGLYDPQQDLILSPRYGNEEEADAGIDALNKAVRDIVNPPVAGQKFNIGDRVLCCKNFSADDIWNGDTGTVTGLDFDDKPIVELDRDQGGEMRTLSKEQVKECRLGYAMSVHKAQGSQFRRVFFVCLAAHYHMLSRSLIYTAITRAKQGCVVLGELRAFRAGIRKAVLKRTVLQELLGMGEDENDLGI